MIILYLQWIFTGEDKIIISTRKKIFHSEQIRTFHILGNQQTKFYSGARSLKEKDE